MKVKIGKYKHFYRSQLHYDYMNKKYDYKWDNSNTYFEKLLEHLENAIDWFYDHTINFVLKAFPEQRMKIRIDPWDTWSMDHTLSHIIVPMLKQLKETKHGSPLVDDEDVPEELRSTNAPAKENDWDTDENWFKRWDWVMNEMIWSFEQKCLDNGWEEAYYQYEVDKSALLGMRCVWRDDEGRKKHQERMNNGFRLFGKYYEGLWD